jgi:hypothetical protein
VPVTPQTGAGDWQPTPPAYAPPLTPWMATMRPFLIQTPSQFRSEGPPALESEQYALDYNETRLYGALNNSLRTSEQTEIGLFYTEHTGAQYNRIFREFALGQNMSVADRARLFAMLYLAGADSLIAAWDSKFYFHFWRPVTAIRAGTRTASLTDMDATWGAARRHAGASRIPGGARLPDRRFCRSARAFTVRKKSKSLIEHRDEHASHFREYGRFDQGNHRRPHFRRDALPHVGQRRRRDRQESRQIHAAKLLSPI